MEIVHFSADEAKEIFTAKCNDGYVGCVKTDVCICFTLDKYDTALAAANKARSLKKALQEAVAKKETPVKKLVNVKDTTKKPRKKVTCVNKLYTLTETQAMPLLSFKEVWIITKGDQFVADCINKEKKELCSYTNKQEKARVFDCHEEAKMMMKTLRGTVGPGFDLMRFFIKL